MMMIIIYYRILQHSGSITKISNSSRVTTSVASEPFYTANGKKDRVLGQRQKKLMMWKVLELSTNMWRKTSSDVSGKVTRTSKTNQGLGELLLWKMRP